MKNQYLVTNNDSPKTIAVQFEFELEIYNSWHNYYQIL